MENKKENVKANYWILLLYFCKLSWKISTNWGYKMVLDFAASGTILTVVDA